MTELPAVVVSPVGTEMVPVATLANVLTPEKYGMFPTTPALVVESPPNPTVAPLRVIGQVVEIVPCLVLRVDCKSVPLSDRVPKKPLVEEA
jgi:hypothetical protein